MTAVRKRRRMRLTHVLWGRDYLAELSKTRGAQDVLLCPSDIYVLHRAIQRLLPAKLREGKR